MEITHEKARWFLELRADQALNEQEHALLALHLQGCADCRSYASDMSEVERSLKGLLRQRWSQPPIPLSLPALRERTRKARIDTMMTMRKLAVGLAVAAFFFSAWQVAVFGSRDLGAIPMLAAPIPTPSTQSTSTSAPRTDCEMIRYITRPEDTLEGIAAMFSASEQEILAVNHLPGGSITPGMELIIPGCQPTPTGTVSSPEETFTHTPRIYLLTTTPVANY